MESLMNKALIYFKLFALLVFISNPCQSHAKTVDELIENGELSISVKVIAPQKIIAKQAIIIQIEVATNRWFAKGTRIQKFAVAEAVILPISELAINGVKKIKGVTWASQIREITLYPMQVGIYEIPAILVDVSVNSESNGVVDGTVQTKPLEIETYKPEALAQIENYLVTPQLDISIEGKFDATKAYQQGDAVTQTISITVKDVPAMMISPLLYENLPGLSVYQKAAKVFDENSRGSLTGQRVESYTYIFEQSGDYTLPEQLIYWWNSQTGSLESEVIPASSWSVNENIGNLESVSNFEFMSLIKRIDMSYLLLFFVSIYLLVYSLKYRNTLINKYKFITKKHFRVCRSHFLKAIENKQWQSACHWLYQAAYTKQSSDTPNEDHFIATLSVYYQGESKKLLLLNKLFQLAYKNDECSFKLHEAKYLISKQKRDSATTNYNVMNKVELNVFK